MYRCEFTLNNQPMSRFCIAGLSFPAFSGLDPYVNKVEHRCVAQAGPIPPGYYYICDRPVGGRLGWLTDVVKRKTDWFALFAKDRQIDDKTWCDKVERGQFRLHPARFNGISRGCITLQKEMDFSRVRTLLLRGHATPVGDTGIMAYGLVRVS